jgi:hypothetical protein
MAKQVINEEFRRMQKLAGLINENKESKEINEVSLMNMNEKWMESWRKDFEEIASIMEKYKNEDPITSFDGFFFKDLRAKYGEDRIKPAIKDNGGLWYPFVWAVDNLAVLPKQEKLISKDKVIYRGGPNNKWVLRKFGNL